MHAGRTPCRNPLPASGPLPAPVLGGHLRSRTRTGLGIRARDGPRFGDHSARGQHVPHPLLLPAHAAQLVVGPPGIRVGLQGSNSFRGQGLGGRGFAPQTQPAPASNDPGTGKEQRAPRRGGRSTPTAYRAALYELCATRNRGRARRRLISGLSWFLPPFLRRYPQVASKSPLLGSELTLFPVFRDERRTFDAKGVHFAVKTTAKPLLTLERLGQGYGRELPNGSQRRWPFVRALQSDLGRRTDGSGTTIGIRDATKISRIPDRRRLPKSSKPDGLRRPDRWTGGRDRGRGHLST